MGGAERDAVPDSLERDQAVLVLLMHLHDIAGNTAHFGSADSWAYELRGPVDDDRLQAVRSTFICPYNPAALPIDDTCEQSLVIQFGHTGGGWDLSYGTDDLAHAKSLLSAAVGGHVKEIMAPGRSRLEVTFADGTMTSSVGHQGHLTFLLPLPFWTKRGRTKRYEPYRGPQPERDQRSN